MATQVVMIKYSTWPPPEGWCQVTIPWTQMLDDPNSHPLDILQWVKTAPGGRYHLHGWTAPGSEQTGTDGFAFRFEQHEDAVLFALRWS